MNELKIFQNEAFGEVRVLRDETGELLFVAKDVALALEYDWNGASRVAHVPDEWKRVTSVVTLRGDEQNMVCLTEQGLYFFLGRSDKPKALPFQKWLAGDVVPSIRKTGSYGVSSLPQTYIEALKALVVSEEAKMLAQATAKAALEERDHAIKTKALIGERREATAMNTASQLSKENGKLKEALGEGKTYKQVKAIPWVLEVFKPSPGTWSALGKKLRALSKEMGYEVRQVEESRYGTVGAYHVDVIARLYNKLMAEPEMMWKNRKA